MAFLPFSKGAEALKILTLLEETVTLFSFIFKGFGNTAGDIEVSDIR